MKIPPVVFSVSLSLLAFALPARAQNPLYGAVWELSGTWHVNRAANPLRPGELLPQGALLSADAAAESHAIVLLAAGQRLFFDCHDIASCGQGFRLPQALGTPSLEQARVFRTACSVRREKREWFPLDLPPNVTRVEAVGVLGKENSVDLTQALRALPPGEYRVAIAAKGAPRITDQELHRGAAAGPALVQIPKAGLYELRFYGGLQVERMRVYLLVTGPASFEAAQRDFNAAGAVVRDWTEHSSGWPGHDFLLAYLLYVSGNSGTESVKATPARN